jgi:diguanylate cyclase (GGDEF)-like protein
MQDFGPRASLLIPSRNARAVMGDARLQDDEERRDLERDGWFRTMSASIAMIRHAYARLEAAEEKMAAQEKRISELEQQITLDELTGLLNRRGFFDAFMKEMDRVARGYSTGGLLILVDLDNFKMINDTYGHPAGDAALRLVGKTLAGSSRAMDACARLGGDEFVLLLANTEREKALVRAQNLIKQLNNLSLVWYGAELPIRASLGLKDYAAGESAESIFGEADTLLYKHKRSNKGLPERKMFTSF